MGLKYRSKTKRGKRPALSGEQLSTTLQIAEDIIRKASDMCGEDIMDISKGIKGVTRQSKSMMFITLAAIYDSTPLNQEQLADLFKKDRTSIIYGISGGQWMASGGNSVYGAHAEMYKKLISQSWLRR